MPLRVDLVYPRMPPAIDGIGDHTYRLAVELAAIGVEVRILTHCPDPGVTQLLGELGVGVAEAWPTGNLRVESTLVDEIAGRAPDWVVLQFEQFAYGRRGRNRPLSFLFRDILRKSPGTQTFLYAHETYTKPETLKRFVMWSYQRAQFRRLTNSANLVALTTDAWRNARDFRGPLPVTIPVFSNVPLSNRAPNQLAIRQHHGIDSVHPVVVHFGNFDASRSEYLLEAAQAISTIPCTFLYIGRDVSAIRQLFAGIRNLNLVVVKSPSLETVSDLLSVSTIALAPFVDGVTTRRGSFLAALQHGLPTVTTSAPNEVALAAACARGVFASVPLGATKRYGEMALALLQSDVDRREMSIKASNYYLNEFDAGRAAKKVLTALLERPSPRS